MIWLAASLARKAPVSAISRYQGKHMATGGEAQTSRFEADMDTGMARMMQDMHSPGYTGRPDSDFLAMMIPHHEGAVDMARLVLIHGRDSMVRQIAEEIIASQTVEFAAMRGRMAVLRAGPNLSRGVIRRWGQCGAAVECTGCGGVEGLASAGRYWEVGVAQGYRRIASSPQS